IGNGGAGANLVSSAIIDNSNLVFDASDTITYANVISGTGTLAQNGTGTTVLTGNETYTGITTINNGTLQIGNGGAGANLVSSAIIDNSNLVFDESDTITYANVISGTGTVTQNGTGTTVLTGNETYTGITTINAGTLQIGNGSSGANLVSSGIVNNGSLVFDETDTITYANVISGTGTVTQNGTGTTVLTGNETYTGDTIITAGTLQVGNGGSGGLLTATGNIIDNSNLIFDTNVAQTYAVLISGTGNLAQIGNSTLTLTADETYTGDTTIGALSTLQIGNGGTTGSLQAGNIINSNSLIFNVGANVTYAGVISGTGTLLQSGNASLILTANETYTGDTIIASGTLQVGNGGNSGGLLSGNIIDNSRLVFNVDGNTTFSGVISGNGTLLQEGTGTTFLTGNETYTGDTTITAGTLQIGDGGASGSLVSANIIDNSELVYNTSTSISYDTTISGTGNLTQAGTSTMTLTGNLAYTGNTTVSAGVLIIGNGGNSAGLATTNIIDNSALVFNVGNNMTYNGLISGTGTLQQAGNATLTLTANETYTGDTTISAGSLQIGNGGNSGSLATGNIINNGNLTFNVAGEVTYTGVISGNGPLTQLGNGTLILTADETYTGDTTIAANSTLQLGNNGNSGSIVSSNLIDNGLLIFDINTTRTYAGLISGNGSMTVQGYGWQILTANETYTGDTVISNGTLQIGNGGTSGNLASGNITILSSNTTVGNTTVTSTGTLIWDVVPTLTYNGVISGTGDMKQIAANGTLILTNDNTYTGNTTVVANSTLQIGNGGSRGSLMTSNILNEGQLVFNTTAVHNLSANISGNGTLLQEGILTGVNPANIAATLVLLGNNTYTGLTTILANTGIEVGDGTTVGTLTGDVVNQGNLIFDHSGVFSYLGLVTGDGVITKEEPGILILRGGLSYSGYIVLHTNGLPVFTDDPAYDLALKTMMSQPAIYPLFTQQAAGEGTHPIETQMMAMLEQFQIDIIGTGGAPMYNSVSYEIGNQLQTLVVLSGNMGSSFSFAVPEIQQLVQNSGVQPLITLPDGSALPAWITYNGATGKFDVNNVPSGGLPLKVLIRVGSRVVHMTVSQAQ
ncbi:MAG: beta strand repeat-containing protein, partial [Enterobacteriaceae bacterium]